MSIRILQALDGPHGLDLSIWPKAVRSCFERRQRLGPLRRGQAYSMCRSREATIRTRLASIGRILPLGLALEAEDVRMIPRMAGLAKPIVYSHGPASRAFGIMKPSSNPGTRPSRPASACQPRAQHAVPPHDRAGHKHRRRGQSEYRPNRLRRLIAEPGPLQGIPMP